MRVRLVAALAAAGAVIGFGAPHVPPPLPPGRLSPAQAWPHAHRADLPGALPDGSRFQPMLYADATTVAGTAPSPDGKWLRLVLRRGAGAVRELTRLPYAKNPVFGSFTVTGDDLLWTQSATDGDDELWTTGLRTWTPARRLTADLGNPMFFGTENDLVVAGGRVYWAAAPSGDAITEIRSVALTGGPVRVREQAGEWALSAWPWLIGDQSSGGTTRLRDMLTGRTVAVQPGSGGLATCSPVWCRVMVTSGGKLDHVDLMHPDGSGRRRIAGGGAQAALSDVALLDRFELLSEPGPDSDLTGTSALLVYDLSTGRTILLSPGASAAFGGHGVIWWSTGDDETVMWHSLDLRTA